MGFEDFQVRLSSKALPSRALELVSQLPNVQSETERMFADSLDRRFFRYEDDSHIVEILLCMEAPDEEMLSVRFAVCQASTIEGVFFSLVDELIVRLNAKALVTEEPDEPELDRLFDSASLKDFHRACRQGIEKQRRLWKSLTGVENVKASCGTAVQLGTQSVLARQGTRVLAILAPFEHD